MIHIKGIFLGFELILDLFICLGIWVSLRYKQVNGFSGLAASLAKKLPNRAPKRRRRINTPNSQGRISASPLQIDKATIAANLQLQEQQRELIYNIIALVMKFGLLAIFAGSFVRLGVASHQRIMRHLEISSVLKIESKKLDKLNTRFDRLFTIGGQNRLIREQDHLIAPNSFRVIWK